MTGATKRKTLLMLGAAIFIIVILAAALPRLEFQPGMPLPSLQHGELVAAPDEEEPYVSISTTKFILVFIGIVLTGATLYSAYQLFRGADWRLISAFLRYILLISVMIGCLVFLVMLIPNSNISTPAEIPVATPQPVVTSPLGSAPPSLLWLVGAGLLVIGALVVMWAFSPSRQPNPIDLVGLEAEKAHHALTTGGDLKDVIVHCYTQMSLALKQEKGIERKEFMTTGEFETLLKDAGIPHEPIHQLTRLFDAVRYGHWQPNSVDEQKAIQCLEAIMVHSRTIRGIH